MSSISFCSSSHYSDRAEHTLAQQAAYQAGHDEQVSRAYNLGAAYALIRVFECGCHYVDVHAYESPVPTRKAAPFSTFTSIHDFLRGPCIKSTCADIECPDWWYSDQGKGKYGIKDLEDWDEIIGEAEEWEEKIENLVAAYRSLSNPIKEQLHDITYRYGLEKMDWLLICPPMWDRQMLIEWCPEIQDVKAWRQRGTDMALSGAPRNFYEFCIDAAWASLKLVRHKVTEELEAVVRALEKRQEDMARTTEVPRDLAWPPSPKTPVSPGTVPTLKMLEERTPSSKSSKYRRLSSVEAEIISAQASKKGTSTDSQSSVCELPDFSEPQAFAGASDTPDVDHFYEVGRWNDIYRPDSWAHDPFMYDEDAEESSPEAQRPDSPIPSSHAVPTPDQWRAVFPDAITGASTGMQTEGSQGESPSDQVPSTKHPNVSLPSPAAAALFDAFTSARSVSTWSRVSSISHETKSRQHSTNAGNDWDFGPSDVGSLAAYVSDSEFDSNPQSPSERPEDFLPVFEPRPLFATRSITQIITYSDKRSQDDNEAETSDNNECLRAKKRSRVSRLSALKAVPSYVELKELTGMRIEKVTERADTEDLETANATSPAPVQMITTTFMITSIYNEDAVDDSMDAYNAIPSSDTDLSDYPVACRSSAHPAPSSAANRPSAAGDVSSKHSSRKTVAKAKGWLRGLLKPLRLFQPAKPSQATKWTG